MALLSNGTNGWPLVACLEFKIARDRMHLACTKRSGRRAMRLFAGMDA
jgi:hypothetical protein